MKGFLLIPEIPTSQNSEQSTGYSATQLTDYERLTHYSEYGVVPDAQVRLQKEASAGIIDLEAPDVPFQFDTKDVNRNTVQTTAPNYASTVEQREAPASDEQNLQTIKAYSSQHIQALRTQYTLAA